MSNRDPFFDVLKFIAIIVVVFGHVCDHTGLYIRFPQIEGAVIGMNMPLFFLISGYFSEKSGDWGAAKKTLKRLVQYFWPLAFISVVFSFPILFSEKTLMPFVVGALKNFLFTKWFLYVLMYCMIVTLIANRITKDGVRRIYLAVVFAASFFCDQMWYLNSFRAMFPYYVIGKCVLPRAKVWERWPIGISCGALFVLVVLLEGDVRTNGLSFYDVNTAWANLISSWSVIPLCFARFSIGIFGGIGCMWIVYELMRRVRWISRLAPFGMTTLGVYLIHTRFIGVIDFGGGIYSSAIATALIFLVCHLFVCYSRRIRLVEVFLWGYFWHDARQPSHI